MKKKLLAMLLALAMMFTLAACGGNDQVTSGESDAPDGIQSVDPDASETPAIVADLSQDVLTFSAGLSADDVMLTVNGEDIPADLFLYWLFFDCYNFESTYFYYGITVDDFADMLLDDAVSMAISYTLLRQKAAELGCPLTDEQLAEAAASLTEEEGIIDRLKTSFGLSDASIDYVSTINYYYENMLSTLPEPTEEELNDYAYQVKHILIATTDLTTGEALDDATIAEKKALAEDILSQLQAVEGEAQLALFDELMNEYSEDTGLATNPDGYEFTVDDSLVDGFSDAALALKPGEISGIVETDYGYHIMLRGEVEDIVANYAEDYQAHQLNELMDQWTEEADVVRSDLLDSLDVVDFYNRYMAYQSALADAEGAEG